MNILVNGRDEAIDPCTIAELVGAKGLPAGSLVVEHNRQIVKQAQWSEVHFMEGDELELLSFVGGG